MFPCRGPRVSGLRAAFAFGSGGRHGVYLSAMHRSVCAWPVLRRHPALFAAAILLTALPAAGLAPAVRAADTPAGLPATAQARPEAVAGGFSSYRLANGFRIILAPFPAAATARVELLVRTGSKREGYGEAGMAHLLEHMLFKGAGPYHDLKRELTALGAAWNGTTSADRTNYFSTVIADPDRVDALIRIEAERLIRPSFTEAQLAREMTVVRNELERRDSDATSLMRRALQRQSYFWHGYGRPTIGARSDIEGAPFSALQDFHRRHYRPDNAALIVSGRFDPARVLALAAGLFAVAANPPGPAPGDWTRDEARAMTNRSELYQAGGRTMAMSGWRLPGSAWRQTAALELASRAVCENGGNGLRKALMLEQGIAVAVSCSLETQADYSLLVAHATADEGIDAATLAQALHEHVERMASDGLTRQQLERVRRASANARERLRLSHEALAEQLSQAEAAGDWRLFFLRQELLDGIALDEVNQAMRAWLVPGNRSDVLLHDVEVTKVPGTGPVPDPSALVEGRRWPDFAPAAVPPPGTLDELAAATVRVPLDDERAQAALLPRRTQGDMAWVTVANDYGSQASLAGRSAACALADSLMTSGGGLSREALTTRMSGYRARWSLGLGGIALEVPRRQVDAALGTLLDVWRAPEVSEAEFRRMKAAVVSGLEAGMKSPVSVAAARTLQRFDNYPEDHPGRPRSLEAQLAEARAVSLADVRGCLADFGGIARVRLAMVGDFTPEDVRAVWQRVASLPAAPVAYERVIEPEAPSRVDETPILVAMADQPNATVSGTLVLPLTTEDPDFPALRLAVSLLGGDTDSRIRMRLREQEGLAYAAGATLSGAVFEPRSTLLLYASVASGQAAEALAALREELQRALAEGFSEDEVARARRVWLDGRRRALASEAGLVPLLAGGLQSGRDFAALSDYDARLSGTGAADVNRVLRKYLAAVPVVWATGRGVAAPAGAR